MLASLESAVPITASAIYSTFYNKTSDLEYPWGGSFYFLSTAFTAIGVIITLIVYFSLGCKQIEEEDGENKQHKNPPMVNTDVVLVSFTKL